MEDKVGESREITDGDKAILEQAIAMSLSTDPECTEHKDADSPFMKEAIGDYKDWEGPTAVFLGHLQEMGFSKNACIKGLYHTQNYSVDEAASWILNHLHLEDIDEPLEIGVKQDLAGFMANSAQPGNPCKMVFVVNTELSMGVGKIAAQVGHATISLHRKMLAEQDRLCHNIVQWEGHGELKIVVKGQNATHLMDLERQAEQEHLETYLVHDAGRTQVSPGSATVLGIFGTTDVVDKITGTLKLL